MKVGIFAVPEGHQASIISACEELGIDNELIDIFSPDWVDEFQQKRCDGYILRPPNASPLWRNVYLKRLYLVRDYLEGRCVPTLESILYYESKILMADLFRLANIPHPKTEVLFRLRDAWQYASTTRMPKIVKTDGGASSIGVHRFHSRTRLRLHVLRCFLTNYVSRGWHSVYDVRMLVASYAKPWHWFIRSKMDYFVKPEISQGYVIFQDAVDVAAEWRIVVIGRSFFGHQKLPGKNRFHSGSDRVGWVAPPFPLLDRVRAWCEALNLNAMTFDIFEDKDGDYYVSEMQAVMGAYAPSQMYVDGIPGRYVYGSNGWEFQEGEFCRHACNLLRIETLRELIQASPRTEAKSSALVPGRE